MTHSGERVQVFFNPFLTENIGGCRESEMVLQAGLPESSRRFIVMHDKGREREKEERVGRWSEECERGRERERVSGLV